MKKLKDFFKKISKYLILVFLLLIGLAAVGVLYLFFVPNSHLFGICYISKNSSHDSSTYKIAEVSKVSLSSTNYDVKVVSTDLETVQVKVLNNSFGFVKKETNEINIKSEIVDKTLNFTIEEPTGLALTNNSYIQLLIPKGSNIDLDIKNSSAETTISSEGLKLNDISYSSKNGTALLDTAEVTGNMSLDIGNTTFTLGANCAISNPSSSVVSLNITTGKFDASAAVLGEVKVLNNERGVIHIKECARFTEEVEFAGGSVKIEKLNEAVIKTSDSNVTFGAVTNSVVVKLSKTGSIVIDSIYGISDIKTNQGDVTINYVYSPQLILQTDSGNIYVSNAYHHIEAITSHGIINVNWAEDSEHYKVGVLGTNNRSLSATITGNGKVIAKSVEHVDVQITNKGRAELSMSNILGKNIISGNNGSVYVGVDKNAKYALKTTSESGSVRVNLTQVPNFNGYTDLDHEIVYVNSEKSNYPADENLMNWGNDTNLLSINTKTGSITVLDSNFQ